jgi:hypothetical protein
MSEAPPHTQQCGLSAKAVGHISQLQEENVYFLIVTVRPQLAIIYAILNSASP